MHSIIGFLPIYFLIFYIGIPVAIVYFFYKKYERLAKKRNIELEKQTEALERIASIMERST
ncbi:hypothetical protein [Bacillus sp. OAE603]|uniref:hypothetical protein n=1 Tax=Gottfriedia sp. OAE603 TaxID=2663872 RepID=UPI0017899C14